MPVRCYIDDLMCPNVWYTFGKFLKIKFDGIRGKIYMYGLRFNLAAGFGFSLSSMTEDDNRFIMGGMLEVGVQWNVDFLGILYILLASGDR